LGGDFIEATGINDNGQVVGFSRTATGVPHAFITGPDGVGMRDLGTVTATDINNAGQVVGESGGKAFITGPNGTGMRNIGTLGGDFSEATGINDNGQVVGYSYVGNTDVVHAFITGPNGMGMRDLGTLGGADSYANAINDAGQVVGASSPTATEKIHAFITGPEGKSMIDLMPTDLQPDSAATAINDVGQAVGFVATGRFPPGGFMTGPDGVGMIHVEIPNIGGVGFPMFFDINDAGQVVGYAELVGAPGPQGEWSRHAFVTGPNGVGVTFIDSLLSLPDGVILTGAHLINNAGQVIVTGGTPPIPEPPSYAVMLAGLILLGFVVRSQMRLL
jgi:probable HAF family extracellular repeat protein